MEFLSPEWCDALDHEARASDELREACRGLDLTIEQEILAEDDASETTRYTVIFADGEVRFRFGPHPDPDVTFVQDRRVAEQMSRGETNAQHAFMLGKLRVRGDLPRLVGARDAFVELGDVFARVRERTRFP